MGNDDAIKQVHIRRILRQRYSSWLHWKKPQVLEGVGPYHPQKFDYFDALRQAAIDASKETLQEMSLDRLAESFHADGHPKPAHEYGEAILAEQNMLLWRKEPVWFAGGFNVVGRIADYSHWLNMKSWSLAETVALSIGFEPCGDIFEGLVGRPCQTDVVAFFEKRRDLIVNNFDWGSETFNSKNEVRGLCEWLSSAEVEVPPSLLLAAGKKFGLEMPMELESDTNAEIATYDPRERRSLLKLVLGLAMGGYSYNPSAQRSAITNEICDDLDLLGISMDMDTIRKYLREAAGAFPNAVAFPTDKLPKQKAQNLRGNSGASSSAKKE